MIAICIKYLHRHPLELVGLPAEAIVDLIALAELEAEEIQRVGGDF